MKKFLFVILLAIGMLAIPAFGDETTASCVPKPGSEDQQAAPAAKPADEETVTKTYTLKYVDPVRVKEALLIYYYGVSCTEGSNLITVALPKKRVADFEEQLRKLDVEKKMITLRIFTVIASKEGRDGNIENKDLKRVLGEVSNLLNFKSFTLDGASSISVKDGARIGNVVLSSSLIERLTFNFGRVAVSTNSAGKRSVRLLIDLRQTASGQSIDLIESETEIAEGGYLVAGVSRIGTGGNSLVLVINAEIK